MIFRLSASLALLLLGGLSAAAGTQPYTIIYSAPAGTSFHPAIGAVQGSLIYGSDPDNGAGTLFTLTTAGANAKTLYTFGGNDGVTPNARLVVSAAGTVSGTTQSGGNAGAGTIFQVNAAGHLAWSFSLQWDAEGAGPLDGLALQLATGALWGTTSGGAISPGNGTLFRVSSTHHVTVMHQFQSTQTDGHCPFTGVVFGRGGNLFGTVVGNGFGGQPNGAVWELQHGSPTAIYSFKGSADGEYPKITPTIDGQGNLWGVSQNGSGAIWKLNASGLTVLHSFSGGSDGANPNGPLLLGTDGNLYGTTAGGNGTVFRITPQGALTTLHSFSGGADGAGPTGSLAHASNGWIYGGTSAGTIFRIIP